MSKKPRSTTSRGRPRATRNRSGIVVRTCTALSEMQACASLEKEIWAFPDIDVQPVRSYVVAQKIGGQVIGAFDGCELVGFVMSIPGVRNGHACLHSRVLGVRREYRDTGVGRRLKLFQREHAMASGFDLIEWTFDPLEIKNAYFNIERLGAIVGRYYTNLYGSSASVLQGNLPSDRLVAEWWLRSRRVKKLLAGGTHSSYKIEGTIDTPTQIYQWKTSVGDLAKARQVQQRNRRKFLRAFSRGLVVLRFEVDSKGNGSYLLGHALESDGVARPSFKARRG